MPKPEPRVEIPLTRLNYLAREEQSKMDEVGGVYARRVMELVARSSRTDTEAQYARLILAAIVRVVPNAPSIDEVLASVKAAARKESK